MHYWVEQGGGVFEGASCLVTDLYSASLPLSNLTSEKIQSAKDMPLYLHKEPTVKVTS